MILILTKTEWENTIYEREYMRVVRDAIWNADIVFVMDKEGICDVVKNRKLNGTNGRISMSDIGYIANEERVYNE